MVKKYSQVKLISLDTVLAAGIALSINQIRSWANSWGYDRAIDWEGSTAFRHFVYSNVLAQQLEAHGFLTDNSKTYHVGQVFQFPSGALCLLAQVTPGMCALISLARDNSDANRYCDPIEVAGGCYNVTKEELSKMASRAGQLTPVTVTYVVSGDQDGGA